MKKNGLLAEILSGVVNHEKNKVKTHEPDYYLNQKKQLWYGMMNQLDEDEGEARSASTPRATERPAGSACDTPED